MIFYIDEIPESGRDFQAREARGHFDIDSPDCALSRDVQVEGTLEKIGREVYLSGQVQTELLLVCSRCLEKFNFPVQCKVKARFIPRPQAVTGTGEVELDARDVETEYYQENTVDITQPIHDQILLSVPFRILCGKDCKGLCQQCGKNLNDGPCGCRPEDKIDPRLEILKTLKNKIE